MGAREQMRTFFVVVVALAGLVFSGIFWLSAETPSAPKTIRSAMPEIGWFPTFQDGCQLTVSANNSLYGHALALISLETGDRVATGFVRPGGILTATFPCGSYSLVEAAGTKWNGQQELFGPQTLAFARDLSLEDGFPFVVRVADEASGDIASVDVTSAAKFIYGRR